MRLDSVEARYAHAMPKDEQIRSPGPSPRRKPFVDDIDRQLLTLLSRDALTPNNVLAAAVGVAPSTCLVRVRALRSRGVIRGVHVDIDLEALGLPLQALIAVRLATHSREAIATFQTHVQALPKLLGIFHVSGTNDYLLHVAAESAQSLRDFVVDSIATRSEVGHAETSLIFDYCRNPDPLP
jgi:DNA-binding Lrp family transcriptional regulator